MKDHYFNLKYLAGLLIYACAFVSASTQAVTLNPGETVPLSGTTAVLSPETAGPIIDEQIANFAIEIDGNMVTGAVSQRLRNFQGFGLLNGRLIDYRITSFDDQGLGLQIEGLNTQIILDVPPFEVDYRLDEPGDIFPVTASLQDIQGIFSPVEFDFGSSPLVAGETSRWMFVGGLNDFVVFGDWGAQLLALTPTGTQYSIPFDSYFAVIPIPASLPLMACGLIGLIGIARRKKAA